MQEENWAPFECLLFQIHFKRQYLLARLILENLKSGGVLSLPVGFLTPSKSKTDSIDHIDPVKVELAKGEIVVREGNQAFWQLLILRSVFAQIDVEKM